LGQEEFFEMTTTEPTERKTPDWKESATQSGLEPMTEDPFGLEPRGKREPLELPEPVLDWSAGEKNLIQKVLLEETEAKCLKLHGSLAFYERLWIDPAEWACYSVEEAAGIIMDKSPLNMEQIAASLNCQEDLFIQALAGTGKTSLLSACISYLMAIGKDPEKISISSHTVAAAEEIKSRIFPTLDMLFPKTKEALGSMRPTTGTIHAIAYRDMIAHKHPKARWTILDEPQQFRVWKEASLFAFPERAGMNMSDDAAGEEMRLFDRVRGYDIPEAGISNVIRLVSENEELPKVAETYAKIKEARKLIDYTDLLREWAPIIMHPGYRGKWDYFFVDEFQDTNPLQKFLLKLLKLGGTKLIVCGDNRQSINSFTGSDPTSHETFFKEFKIREAWLLTNYRCSREIIALANEVLGSMMPPEEGRLKAGPNAPEGVATKLVMTRRESDRRRFLPPKEAEAEKKKEAEITCHEAISLMKTLTAEMEENPSVAVLYRTNAQGSLLEETMARINGLRQKQGLPAIKYIRKDYRRTALRAKTEREILSILNAWCAPQTAAWENLLLSPYFHGVGEVTARNIQRKADKNKPQSMEESMSLFDRELSRRNAETVGEFFTAWETALGGPEKEMETPKLEDACEALRKWIAKVASKKSYDTGSKREAEESQRRSYETSILERVTAKGKLGKTLGEAVAEVSDENDKASQAQANANRALGLASKEDKSVEKEDGVILSTIHLAKGREYDGVVVHQVSRGSLPHFNALRFYENGKNMKEKQFRKYASFPELQGEKIDFQSGPMESDETARHLPRILRTGLQENPPQNDLESWEDHNNPLEEEKRLLYVAVTRAKKRLVLTSKDHNYEFLPRNLWEKLKRGQILRDAQK
jgi:superfamily I DNA/RNA helicase